MFHKLGGILFSPRQRASTFKFVYFSLFFCHDESTQLEKVFPVAIYELFLAPGFCSTAGNKFSEIRGARVKVSLPLKLSPCEVSARV